MIGETLRNPSLIVEGEALLGPIPVPAGLTALGIRFDGSEANPDCAVEIACEFSADGQVWRPIGGLKTSARAVAKDLPDFPGSAFTLWGTHDGREGFGRLRVACPESAAFSVWTGF